MYIIHNYRTETTARTLSTARALASMDGSHAVYRVKLNGFARLIHGNA